MNNIDFDNWLQKAEESLTSYEKSLAKFNEYELDVNKADPNNFEENLLKQFTDRFGTKYDEVSAQIFSLLENMFRVFLVSSLEQRDRIINAFSGKKHLLNFLIGYPEYVSKFIHSKDDLVWVKVGLVAALIEGGKIDFRDLWSSLGELYFKAKKCGIDADTQFKEVESSMPNNNSFLKSFVKPKGILSEFLNSAYLKYKLEKDSFNN